MAIHNMYEWIVLLEKHDELVRIKHPIDRNLEITEICDRVMKAPGGGPALLFENVVGSDIPILVNSYGSRRRLSLLFGTDHWGDLLAEYVALLDQKPVLGVLDKLKMLPKLKGLHDCLPIEISQTKAPCMEIKFDEPDLSLLPACKCWPLDGGTYMTFPQVFSRDPKTFVQNCGMYRLQIFDKKSCGMHWHLHKGGAEHLRSISNTRLPVSITFGGGPVEQLCAAFPLPQDFDEMLFAGLLRSQAVKLVKCRTNDLLIPAEADIVLEGFVDSKEMKPEGPFGDHTGYYSMLENYPVFHLTAMSMRKQPVYPHTVVGRPPMEDAYIGEWIEKLSLPVLRKQFPEIRDLHMPPSGNFHNFIIVSIKKAYPGHARKVMNSLWGTGQLMFSKCIIVIDEDVDVRDYNMVLWRTGNSVDWARDIEVVKGPVDDLDHASEFPRFGGKIGIDGTKKGQFEGHNREWPPEINMLDSVKKRIDEIWDQLGISVNLKD